MAFYLGLQVPEPTLRTNLWRTTANEVTIIFYAPNNLAASVAQVPVAMRFPLTLMPLCLALPAMAQISMPIDPTYYRDTRDRIDSYLFRTYTDPTRLAWLLFDSANEHWGRSPRNWDQSPKSYSMRVASGWGRRIARNTVQLAFESALHEDSRYRRSAGTTYRA